MTPSTSPAQSRRILVVDDGIGVWGSHRCLLRLAPFFEAHNFTLGLLSPFGSDFSSVWEKEGFEHTYYFEPRVEGLSVRDAKGKLRPLKMATTALALVGRAARISQVARKFRADIILANSFWTHFDVAATSAVTRRSALLYLHEECSPGLPATALRTAVRFSQSTIAVSNDVAASVNLPERVQVINNGIDIERFTPGPLNPALRSELATDPQQPLVVSISRLDEAKQVDHIIRAVAELEGPLANTQLAIIGDATSGSSYYQELITLGDELLSGRVRFLPWQSDVPEILRSADVFVLAGKQEGMPLGVLEAQASGCSVVAYPAAGVRDSVIHGQTGMVATPNEWSSLSKNITQVLNDEGLRRRIEVNARRLIEERFTLDHQAEQMTRVLDGL